MTQSGQVFASVGNGTVGIYDSASGHLISTLNDGTGEPYTAGGAFDTHNNFYVTDDLTGAISKYDPSGTLLPQFASGLSNPLSLTFDGAGNLYVGQQTTPYVAAFNPSGIRQPDVGPMQTQLYGVDWIDLAGDQCTLYYTTEGTDILRYNKCTNTQLSNFNAVPFTGAAAYEMRIRPNGQVLVADSSGVLQLNSSGSVLQTYPCSSLPGCAGQLFAVNLDPSGTSFWTGDSYSGNIWQVDIATGQVLQTISTASGVLYGLTINGEINVATSAATQLTVQTATAPSGGPTTVTGVLTNAATSAPISGEPVTFTLNGTQSCTGTTDGAGRASCVITPTEVPGTYPLTGSFPGDTAATPSLSGSAGVNTVAVTPDVTTLSYIGPSAVVTGLPITLSAVLTSSLPSPGTPVAGQTVVFHVGSGSTAQSCSGTTDASGVVSCRIAAVGQSGNTLPVTVSFGGSPSDLPSGTSSTPLLGQVPASGGFVIGDVSAGHPTLGSAVNFWGAQLWKTNIFSGGSAPASMKGYADNVSTYACGGTFTTRPGNSSKPPATIPSHMVVIVSSSIDKSGPNIAGTIVHLVIVQTNSGYGPNPGHDGTGTIVATIC